MLVNMIQDRTCNKMHILLQLLTAISDRCNGLYNRGFTNQQFGSPGHLDGVQVPDLNDCVDPCSADLNGDTIFDFFDISFLLQNSVDFNGDTGFDFFDISAFLQAGANCP